MSRLFASASSEKIILGADTVITTNITNISLGGWVYINTYQDSSIICNGFDNGSGRGYTLKAEVTGGNNRMRIEVAYVGSITSTTNLTTGVWIHVIATRGSSTWNLYVNGTSEANGTYTPNSISGEAETVIGARKTSAGGYEEYFDGKMAELAFWDRVLSASEVLSLSKGLSPLFYPDALLFYKPLRDESTTATDYVNSATWTMSGTTKDQDHPRIYYPTYNNSRKYKATAAPASSTYVNSFYGPSGYF